MCVCTGGLRDRGLRRNLEVRVHGVGKREGVSMKNEISGAAGSGMLMILEKDEKIGAEPQDGGQKKKMKQHGSALIGGSGSKSRVRHLPLPTAVCFRTCGCDFRL